MFRRVKLKRYLLGAFALLLVLTGIITACELIGLINTEQRADILIEQVSKADSATKICRIEVNVAARNLREMILTEDVAKRSQMESRIYESLSTIKEQIEIFKQTHGEEDGLAKKYELAFDKWFAIADRATAQIKSGNLEAARQIVVTECSPSLDELVTIAKEIDSAISKESEEHQANMLQTIRTTGSVSIGAFIVALAFGIFVSLYTTRSITGAVNMAKYAVTELAKGNLKVQVNYEADNEFGELMAHMDKSFEELSKYVEAIDYEMNEFSKGNFSCKCPVTFVGEFSNIETSIGRFQEKITHTIRELEMAAEQVSDGAGQVSGGAQSLAQGATEQASSVEELTAAVAGISSGIANTSAYAKQANDVGKNSALVVEKSTEEMNQLLESIHDIADASNNIQSIIKVINDIAFQTNILALNAAVEAARAGTAGKGFAVVADEVRDLAQKTAVAATDTTELIETALHHVKRGEDLAIQAETAFGEVSKSAGDILQRVEQIATVSQEQADSIAQISQGLEQISAVVQTTSATAEESAAASEELNGQAGMMRSLLSQFELSEPESY